jgi:hypothetical protein
MTDDNTLADADNAAESLAQQMRSNPGADVRPSNTPDASDALRGAELDKIFSDSSDTEPVADPYAESKRESGIKDEPEVVEETAKPEPTVEPAEKAKKSLLDSLSEEKIEKTEAVKKEEDPYEKIKLRADASPKTRETFDSLKATAKEREKTANDRATALEKQVEELSVKVKASEGKTMDPAVESELKELRAHRAQFDTENDPDFKTKFDKKIESNYETIYAKLKDHSLPEETVAALKALPAAERDAHIEEFLSKIPNASKRLIEAKLIDNTSVQEQRRQELSEVRSKADTILADRAKAPAETAQKLEAEVAGYLRPVVEKLQWLQLKEVPATATANEKTSLEKYNKDTEFLRESLKTAILDHSPRSRAEAALAVPLAHYYKAQYTAANSQLEKVTKELEGIRRASQTSRTARTSANPSQAPVAQKNHEFGGDAVDELFKAAGGTL